MVRAKTVSGKLIIPKVKADEMNREKMRWQSYRVKAGIEKRGRGVS